MKIKRLLIICVLLFLPLSLYGDGWDSPSGFDTGSDQQLATTDSPTFADLTLTGQLFLPTNNDPSNPTIALGNSGFYEAADGILRVVNSPGDWRWEFNFGLFGARTGDAAGLRGDVSASAITPTVLGRRDDLDTGLGAADLDIASIIAGGVEMWRYVEDTSDYSYTDLPVMIGTSTAATGTSTATLTLGDNVSFPTLSTNQAALYNKSGEMFAIDEDENEAQLTGNTDDYPGDMEVSVNYPYVNPRSQNYVGIKTYISEHKALELLQDLLRSQGMLQVNEFIIKHVNFAPVSNWENNQEAQRLRREREIQEAQDKLVNVDFLIDSKIIEINAEADLGKKLRLIEERNRLQADRTTIVVPDSYAKRQPPEWMKDRGVKLE